MRQVGREAGIMSMNLMRYWLRKSLLKQKTEPFDEIEFTERNRENLLRMRRHRCGLAIARPVHLCLSPPLQEKTLDEYSLLVKTDTTDVATS